jgi:hypothetical protein
MFMKAIHPIQTSTPKNPRLSNALASCRTLLSQIEKTKDALLTEFRGTLAAHEHLLRLALNEAEALAWQSGVPQLVFPTLAREKVQALAAWHARQQSLHHSSVAFAV